MESMFGSRRMSKKEIPVLYWWFRSNCLFPNSRTFRTQSCWSFITGQCCYSEQILPSYLLCWMCVQSSFHHQLWINTWRSKFEQERDGQYSSCLLILWTKVTKIRRWLTWMYHVLHNTCTMHERDIKTQYIGSTSILLLRKDWSSIRLDRMQSFFKKHFQLIVFRKLLQWKLEKSYTRKHTLSPRPPPKISLKNEWKRDLGSEHAQRSKVWQLSRSFQPNQPTLNPIRERSWWPDSTEDIRKTSRSQEIDVNSFCEEPCSSERMERLVETSVNPTRSSEDRKDFNVEQTRERTVRPVNTHDVTNVTDSSQTRSAHESETFNVKDEILRKRTERSVADQNVSHESMMVNEADMDFRIPGLPHSVVKHAQSTSVRQLIQKFENHPDRHALQQDLRQNQSFDPLSTIKTNDSGCGLHRSMWIARDGTQNAVHSMLVILECRHCLLHVRAFLA